MSAVALIGALIVFRLFSLQIVHGGLYQERAERQYVTPTGEIFDRGSIFFTSKNGSTVAAATIESGFKLAMAPNQLKDSEDAYQKINAIVPIDYEAFMASAQKKNDPYEEIAQKIPVEQATSLADLKIPGVTLYRQKWRLYPGGTLASKAVGFVSYKDDKLIGNYGLESYYNDVLSRTGSQFYVNFFAEIFANVQSTIFKNDVTPGDIVTSIEPLVQTQLEHTVASVQEKWGSDAVGGVIMDPHTGEILAMAQVPTFDLNNFGTAKNVSVYANPFAQDAYEMGSIIKPIVMASAIDTGAVTPKTTYFDAGSVVVSNKTISNFDRRGRGTASMQDVLSQSLNTGMVFVQQKMGKEKFKEYMLDRFKIGERTGIDLPGEIRGLTGNLKGNNDVNYANAAFGQGMALTPLEVIRGYAALANGGYLVTPHLAVKVQQENGTEHVLSYDKSGPILKPETVATITDMLVHVVDDGYHRGLPHHKVAAKTGTAQIARPGGQGYYDDRNLHSLVGYFPADHPQFVLYLYNYYPKNATFASVTLAEPFFNMVHFLIDYYELTPER